MHQRLEGDDVQSVTRRLLSEPGLLEAKLLEEAQELCEASLPDEVIHEAADVLYMVMGCLARAGVPLSAVEQELGRRHRRVSRRPVSRKS